MWRREFIALLPASALAAQSRRLSADEVLKDLMAGNERFLTGKTLNPRQSPADFSKLALGQAPEVVIVGCADSRVPPEILFDQGVGDLFVVRVAGNVISGAGPIVKGSIAYAVAVLGAPLVMVLGGCAFPPATPMQSSRPHGTITQLRYSAPFSEVDAGSIIQSLHEAQRWLASEARRNMRRLLLTRPVAEI